MKPLIKRNIDKVQPLRRVMDGANTPTSLTMTNKTDLDNEGCLYGEWVMMFQTEDSLKNRRMFSFYIPNEDIPGTEIDMSNYEPVASLDMCKEVCPFFHTQNAHSSWSRNARDGKTDGVSLIKPLEVDEDGREWGHRSSMVGDILLNPRTGVAFVCMPHGWAKAYDTHDLDCFFDSL